MAGRNMNGYEIVDSSHHSSGKNVTKTEWKTIRTTFHNFASLPAERGMAVDSPTLECHGLKWRVAVFPGGDYGPNPHVTSTHFSLCCESSKEKGQVVKAAYVIRFPTAGVYPYGTPLCGSKGARDFGTSTSTNSWGNTIQRDRLLNPSNMFLLNGNLTIEVDIQVVLENFPWGTTNNAIGASAETAEAGWKEKHDALEKKFNKLEVYYKSTVFKYLQFAKPLSLDMLKLLGTMGESTSDVTFEVSHGAEEKVKKTFHAHRLVLSTRCPTLALLVEDYDNGAPIAISDIDPDMFHNLLRFIYGGVIPSNPSNDNLEKEARDIIRAADRFGCTRLKHIVEARLASSGIKTENAADLILFADATSCALLKEAALDYFVANSEAVMATEGYEQVTEAPAIMKEIMAALSAAASSKKRPAAPDGGSKDYKRMRVTDLRKELDAKDLDTDGSKEILINRLETAEKESDAAEALSQIHRSADTP